MTDKAKIPQTKAAPPLMLGDEALDTVAGGIGGIVLGIGEADSTTAYKPIQFTKRIDKATP